MESGRIEQPVSKYPYYTYIYISTYVYARPTLYLFRSVASWVVEKEDYRVERFSVLIIIFFSPRIPRKPIIKRFRLGPSLKNIEHYTETPLKTFTLSEKLLRPLCTRRFKSDAFTLHPRAVIPLQRVTTIPSYTQRFFRRVNAVNIVIGFVCIPRVFETDGFRVMYVIDFSFDRNDSRFFFKFCLYTAYNTFLQVHLFDCDDVVIYLFIVLGNRFKITRMPNVVSLVTQN